MSGPSREIWRVGLHDLHCREDRCGPNGEWCDCPHHRGEVMPSPAPPELDALEKLAAVIAALSERITALDDHTLAIVGLQTGAINTLADNMRVLADRVAAMERGPR